MTTATAITSFEVGKTYKARSIGDYDCVYSFQVISRTATQVAVKTYGRDPRRCKVRVQGGVECCSPLGKYSMAPVLFAR